MPEIQAPKERMKTPPKREKNARGEIIVSTIRLKDLDAIKKEEAVDDSASSESEEEEPEPVVDSKEEKKSKYLR